MKERPILFSGAMVRAILDGRKTQTRRVVKPQPPLNFSDVRMAYGGVKNIPCCPYGHPGDRLWVRETWTEYHDSIMFKADFPMHWDAENTSHGETVDLIASDYKWRPSIHMPRELSRITLEVTGVRVEEVQGISEADAKAEGVEPNWCGPLDKGRNEDGGVGWTGKEWFRYNSNEQDFPALSAKESFQSLWDSINARRGFGWEANPWVWVLDFKMVKP